jgi:hypothetical protein
MKTRTLLASLIAAAIIVAGCGATVKELLVASYQGTHTTFAAVDDGERVLCFGSTTLPPVPQRTHCTAGTPGLTDAKHQQISASLVKAFDAEVRLAPVLKLWKQGDPIPTDFTIAQAESANILALAKAIDPNPKVLAWIANVQSWVDGYAKLAALFNGGK